MRARTLVAGGAVLALLAAGAGCSGGSSGQSSGGDSQAKGASQAERGSPAKVVQAAYKTTEGAHTAKVTPKVTMHVNGKSITMTGHGVVDFAKKRSRIEMGMPGGQAKTESRMLNGRLYQKLPAQARKGGHVPKPWISVDMDAAAKKALGAGMGQLTQNAPKDPRSQLGYLRGVSDKDVHKVGTETVHGVKATHYKAEIAWAKAFPGAKQAAKRMKKLTGSATMPVNVWLDKKGRVAQMKFSQKMDSKALTGGGGKAAKTGPVTMDMTQAFSDYGAPVHVTAPPKDQTTDADSLLSGKGGRGSGKGGGH